MQRPEDGIRSPGEEVRGCVSHPAPEWVLGTELKAVHTLNHGTLSLAPEDRHSYNTKVSRQITQLKMSRGSE